MIHISSGSSGEVDAIHRFEELLAHPDVLPEVVRTVRRSSGNAQSLRPVLGQHWTANAPLSVNIDLTVACNYACPHCIDSHIINTRSRLSLSQVLSTLTTLTAGGLRTVILIGGGEPTLHADFELVVESIKLLGLGCAVVSNGSQYPRLISIAPLLSSGDWIRFSLDAGREDTYRRLHLPRKDVTLQQICEGAAKLKRSNPRIRLQFSFLITTPRDVNADDRLASNVDEMAEAAYTARAHGFDYIVFKPYLARDLEGKETVPATAGDLDAVVGIRRGFEQASQYADENFRVIATKNLLGVLRGDIARLKQQLPRCRMQALRHVITPHGTFACPAYRGDSRSLIGSRTAHRTPRESLATAAEAQRQIDTFDAAVECRNIACIYNSTNSWLADVAEGTATSNPTTTTESLPVFL
jgi:pyruvate-formate lyase-activating enzyme